MSTKHTPGPWTIANYPQAVVVQTESHKKTAYGASRYAAIGGFDRSDPEQMAEALANARLIAAAPELLAAIQNVMPFLEKSYQAGPVTHPYLVQLRAAIAKATAS